MGDTLETYGNKRDFRRTPEPRGGPVRARSGRPRFVIHQHDARRRHWDFRLEVEGVLRCWAVPKGPSTDPRQKRLAVQVEDHPVDYLDFEGVIPKDQYGAGPVIVWDEGTYGHLPGRDGESMAAAIDRGHVTLWLDGQKLHGGYAPSRIATGKSARWLLVKMADEAADARRNPVKSQPESVKSRRTIKELGS